MNVHTMSDRESVIAVFRSSDEARLAIEDLQEHGLRDEQLSLVTRADERELLAANPSQHGDQMEKSAVKGAAAGAALGLLAGSALLVIPGLGPVFFAGAMASGITGGIVGGLVGAMGGWGVRDDHVRQYEAALNRGKALVVITGSPSQLADGRALLLASPAESVAMHASTADSTVDD